MKTTIKAKNLILIICLISGLSVNTDAQNLWMKYYDNPVMSGVHGSWNPILSAPSVIYDQDTFKMWYRGYVGVGEHQQIGYAWSLNGWDWNMDSLPVIEEGSTGAWDQHKATGQVMKMNDTLKMWYIGTPDFAIYQTGYAWCVDEQNWNLLPNPVLEHGPPGSWDETQVCGGAVTYDGTMYHMYYLGRDNTINEGVGYAWSYDGINWTKYAGNPILVPGEPGSFYERRLIPSDILLADGMVYLYVVGYALDFRVRIGLVVTELGDWTNLEFGNFGLPVLDVGPAGSWDDRRVTLPSVLEKDDSLYMWYEGMEYQVGNNQIGLATDFEILPPSTCLPSGIHFSTQAEIDSFQINHPYCTAIEGSVEINGNDISNLSGLDTLISIGGDLIIDGNVSLQGLSGLEGLTSIGGDLSIIENDILTSLNGLENIEAGSIVNLDIHDNPNLSECDVASICAYLLAPGGEVEIYDNANGCLDPDQVIYECTEAVDEMEAISNLSISPNPSSGVIHLKYSIHETRNSKLEIFSLNGIKIKTFFMGNKQSGDHEMQLDLSELSGGMYFLRMQAGEIVVMSKIIIQK